MLYNLEALLYSKMRPNNPNSFQKDYCTALAKELERRYPSNGTNVDIYSFAHLLHPCFRGTLLKNFQEVWPRVIKEFTKQNEEEAVVAEVNVTVIEDQGEELEDEFFDAAFRRFAQNQDDEPTQGMREGGLTPLTIELETYFALPRLNTSKVDVLAWWKAQQHSLPLLAQCARKYHCIPASSAPSERLFSASGNLVSAKRSSLNTKNVDMMLYLHENINQVKLTTYDYDLLPEPEEDVLPGTLPGPSQKN